MAKVLVGVIGTGWGQLHIEVWRRIKNADVVAVCDVDEARAKNIAQQYSIEQTYADFHDLVANETIDLISIAAPTELHKPIAHAAIEAGKHVLCEKPLALNANDAREMLASAQSKKIVHAVDFEMRFLPAFAYAKELIDEEYLGPLLRVDVMMTMERPWGEHGNWAADDARGGGVLMEVGSHFIDALQWFFGDVRAVLASRRTHFPSVKIPAPTPSQSLPSLGVANHHGTSSDSTASGLAPRDDWRGQGEVYPVTGDDAFWCVMQFSRGGEALVNFMTGARHDPGWSLGAYGQRGTLLIQSGQLLGMRAGDREMTILPIPHRLELSDKPRDPMLWGMLKLFERVVSKITGRDESLPYPDFRDGLNAMQIIDAVRRASDERRWVSVG